MTLETPFSRYAVRRVHIREATSSSLVAPTFSMPWSDGQGITIPHTYLSLKVRQAKASRFDKLPGFANKIPPLFFMTSFGYATAC